VHRTAQKFSTMVVVAEPIYQYLTNAHITHDCLSLFRLRIEARNARSVFPSSSSRYGARREGFRKWEKPVESEKIGKIQTTRDRQRRRYRNCDTQHKNWTYHRYLGVCDSPHRICSREAYVSLQLYKKDCSVDNKRKRETGSSRKNS
jgi:hypothetical protein